MKVERRCFILACAAGTLLAAYSATPSQAQAVVEGRVVDDSTERPIPRARVMLLNRYNKTTGYMLADLAGAFRFKVPDQGMYRLDVMAMGYQPARTPVVWTTMDYDSTWLEVRLSPAAVLLAPVEVVGLAGPRTPPLMESAMHRNALGLGYHLTRKDIEERKPAVLSDLLLTLPGISVEQGTSRTGGRTLYMRRALPGVGGGQCPVQVFLEGKLVSGGWGAEGVSIDELANPLDVEMVEVFMGLSRVPPEFLTPNARCGVIAIWTRRSSP
jgi:hypothetical protein